MTCAACHSATCLHSDPVYAGVLPLSPVAAHPKTGSAFLTGGGATLPRAVAGGFVDQRAGNCEADGTRCGGEGVSIHAHYTSETERRDNV